MQFDIGNSAIYEILKDKVDLICSMLVFLLHCTWLYLVFRFYFSQYFLEFDTAYQMDNLFRQTLNEHHYVTDLLIHILELELQYYVSSAAFEENAAKITSQNVYKLLEVCSFVTFCFASDTKYTN